MSVVDPSNTNYPAFNEVWQQEFNCVINGTDTMPICPDNIKERKGEACRCTGDEDFETLAPSPIVNYVWDATNMFITTLNAIINNCQSIPTTGYCNLTYFNTTTILDVGSLLSFSGLTGVIAYNTTRPDRRRNFLDIFQYNDEAVPFQVGFWNLSGPFYAQSLLHFKTYPAIPNSCKLILLRLCSLDSG